ncbi:unnamed protein product [Phytomonas sp. EM1]|nr:unnamed protein product [Phytomonas sp. EM1]|eukprot:CCW62366.1 unnamed protein product [Phytomonas sp. isolate EM1]
MFEEVHTRENIGLPSDKIRKALIEQKKFNCTLKCAYRSVVRHWPNEHAWQDEIRAKMNLPCVMAFCFPSEQKSYTSEILANFYPPQGSYPFFASKYNKVDSGDRMHHTWGQVKELCNTRRVYWIFVPFSLTISRNAMIYEMLYHHVVVEEGIREIIGFNAALDDVQPLLDYFSARNAGLRAEVLAPSILTDSEGSSAGQADFITQWPLYLREELQDEWISSYLVVESAREKALSPLPLPRPSLFGNDPATSVSLRKNKASVQQALRARGLNYIRSVEAWSANEAGVRWGGSIPFPVVVKPACGSGSALVTLCHTVEELRDAFRVWEVQRVTSTASPAIPMVVEEYIDGEEYVFDTVGFEGRHIVTDMWRSWKYPKKLLSTRLETNVEQEILRMASDDPTILPPLKLETFSLLYDRLEFVHDLAELPPDGDERRVVDYALRCIDVLGMRNGCTHCELRIDRRESSPNYGKPVLIELNPRMQGDVPRSTELVGYDQFTLLLYLSAVAAALLSTTEKESDGKESTSPDFRRRRNSNKVPCSLPWPPAPQLYRSLVEKSSNPSERITRHVVFFCAEQHSILFDLGVAKVKGLRTYLRHARGNLFSFLNVWQAVYVSQTVDLLSSPGACVLQGTEEEIRKDTEIIRRMEQATIPSSIKCLSRQLITNIKAAQAMSLQLYLHGRNRLGDDQLLGVTKPVGMRFADDKMTTPKIEIELSDMRGEYGKSPCTCQSQLYQLNAENERLHADWENALRQMPYPPLFISEEDFSFIQAVRSSWNTMIQYSGELNTQILNCSALTASEKESSVIEVAKRLNYFF